MMFLFFSESGYRYGGYGNGGYGNGGYGHGGYGGYGGYGRGYGGKRGIKKMASRKLANNVNAELNVDARTDHLKEKLAEVKRNKAQLKARE